MNTVDIYGDKKVIADILNNEYEGTFVDDTITGAIRANLFRDCTGLTDINFPNATSIGDNAFRNTGLTQLNTAKIPRVTSIGADSFHDCFDLESVNLQNVTSLGAGAFAACTLLTQDTIRLPNCHSNKNSFNGCTGITMITPEMWPVAGTSRGMFNGMGNVVMAYLPYITDIGLESVSTLPVSSNCKVIRLPNCTVQSAGTFGLNVSALRLLDIATSRSVGGTEWWNTSSGVRVLILRSTTLVQLTAIDGNFVTRSPLKKGGAGMDIYVPAALYNDYLNATNWSILADPNGQYNTAHFHPLEESRYAEIDYPYSYGLEL